MDDGRPGSVRAHLALGRGILARVVEHPANHGHRARALARAVSWQVLRRLWRRPVDIAYEGFRLRCHPGSNSASNVWYFTPHYDLHEMAFLDRYLRPGDHVLDIGANIGTYALFCAGRVGPTGRVTAFEPHPLNSDRLVENVRRNGLQAMVDVHASAVSAEAGTVSFHSARDVSNGIAVDGDTRGPTIEVPAVALDDVVAPDPRLAFAKLDVEGAEVLALAGARRLLASRLPAVWLVEVIATQLRWFGVGVDHLYDVFGAAGYEPWTCESGTGELRPGRPAGKANVVFVATSARPAVEARLAERPVAWVETSMSDPGA